MIDQLANDYAGQPVVFLEYNFSTAPYSRTERFFAGLGSGEANFPCVMVDSGNNVKTGPVTFYSAYSTMVEASKARAPKADVSATWMRNGNKAKASVTVKNLSGGPLSSGNSATVHLLTYIEQHIQFTNRYVVDAVSTSISSLGNGATATYDLQTNDLTAYASDWSKLHFIALVDYIPSGSTKYDMLQAAEAQAPSVQPDALYFLVQTGASSVPSQIAQVYGPSSLTWNASESAGWLSVTASGSPATPAQFSVTTGALAGGWQQANVTFSSPDGSLADQVVVKAYLGDLSTIFLPMAAK